MLTISDEQLTNRQEWDSRLMQGQCSLGDCLLACMALGVPASDYLRQCLEEALVDTTDGRSDLYAALYRDAWKPKADADESGTWFSHVRFIVDCETYKGKSKADPTRYAETAFHAAAAILNKSPLEIFNTYYRKKSGLRVTVPDNRPD